MKKVFKGSKEYESEYEKDLSVAGKITLSQSLILSLYTLISAFLMFLKPKQEILYTKSRIVQPTSKKNMSTIWQVKLKCEQNHRVQHATVRET